MSTRAHSAAAVRARAPVFFALGDETRLGHLESVPAQWDAALSRLKSFVER